MRLEVTTGIDIMGFDFCVTAEIEIYHWGCEAKLSGPPENCYPAEPAEWFPIRYTLRLDTPGVLGPEWKIDPDTSLFDVISRLPAVEEACDETVSLEANERRWAQRQMRRRRSF